MGEAFQRYPRRVGETVITSGSPVEGYAAKYQDWLFETHADRLTGRVLDVGSGGDQRDRYQYDGSRIEEYIPLDYASDGSVTVRGDAASLPIRSGAVDTVILREVLEHVPVRRIEPVLSETYRILAPGGTLFLTTPFRFQIHGIGYADTVRLTADGLCEALESVGFEEPAIYKGGGFTESLLSPFQTVWFLLLEKLDLEGLSGLFALVHYPATALAVPLGWLVTAVLEENTVQQVYYLHNMALATKSS